MVLENRVPKSGTLSVSTLAKAVTVPVWISAAAALVTAGVTRLVAPVWSSLPKGEGGTILVQSLWARATGVSDSAPKSADAAMSSFFMASSGFIIPYGVLV